MNKKILAVGLIAFLAVSIGITTIIYFQNQSNQEVQEADTYTLIGTLCYPPVNAIIPAISVTSITPSVSPWPSNYTSANPFDRNATVTISSFILLHFSNKFKIVGSSPEVLKGGDSAFPVGFYQNNVVRVSGQMSYSAFYGCYVMNVTSIAHFTS